MVKLSKLTNKKLSFSSFDFSGFSSSEGWVGYFERKSKFSFELVDEAVDLFGAFFNEHDEIMIVSALSFDDEAEYDENIKYRLKKQYDEAKLLGALLPITPFFEHYLLGDAPLPANALNFHFCKDDFILLSRLIMSHGGVVGEVCFYINTTRNVAIYPHADTGFGCISINGDKESAIEFLNFCKNNDKFKVIINI